METIQTLVGTDADGDFGPQTATALKAWQTKHGIPATGVVDDSTWAVMPAPTAAAACAQNIGGTGFTVSCAVLSQGDTGPAVSVLEAALDQPVDGQFSASTGKALSAAQQAAGLTATATTNRKTWKALKLTGTPVCTPGSTTPALPKDYKQQQEVRKQVAQLAADLLQQPGTTTNKIALEGDRLAKKQIGKPYVYGATGPKCLRLLRAADDVVPACRSDVAASRGRSVRRVRADLPARPGAGRRPAVLRERRDRAVDDLPRRDVRRRG